MLVLLWQCVFTLKRITVRLRIASVTSRRVGELRPSKFNINRKYDSIVTRKCESYLAERTTDTLSKPPENVDDHGGTIKNALFQGGMQVIGHVPKMDHKISLTIKSWEWFDERKILLATNSDGRREPLELRYHAKFPGVQCSAGHDKSQFAIILCSSGKRNMPQKAMISKMHTASRKTLRWSKIPR